MDKKMKIKIILAFTMLFAIILFLVPMTFSKYKSSFSNNIQLSVTRAQYTIKFNSNGGTGTMNDLNVKYATSQNLPSNSFTRSGYDFIGWNTETDGSGISFTDEAEIAYATTTNGDEIILYAQWFNKDYLDDTTELNNYSCTEDTKTFVAPITGNYVLEGWGAQGGSTSENISGNKTIEALEGGKGGYSYGVVHLNVGDEVYITVGCEGQELKQATKDTTIPGGYNGGGGVINDDPTNYQGAGGGATHFAINQNLGELKNYENDQNDILVVAGGGGGSYSSTGIYYYSTGGAGGGLTGEDAIVYYKTSYRPNPLVNSYTSFMYYQGYRIPGADQTFHSKTEICYGSFGLGVGDVKADCGTDAGGGGGWYGGNKVARNAQGSGGGMAGSGGSSHLNTSILISGNTISGNMSIPTHDGSSYMTGNTGDGYARISFINPKYKVKFDANTGTGTMNDMDFVYGTAQNLTTNTFTKTNYAFVGWNTEPDGSGTSYSDGQEVNNLTTLDGAEITLYAQWVAPNIYFQVPPDWNGSTVNVYFFNEDTQVNSGWPGISMTLVDSTKNIYSHTLTDYEMATYDTVVFTNGQNVDSSSGLNSSARQTVDKELTSELYGKILVPELYSDSGVRVFFRSGTNSWIPFMYLWGANGSNDVWPGVQLTEKINSVTYLALVDTDLYNMMIFNKGVGGSGNQTADLNVPIYQDLTFNLNSGPYRIFYYGSWHNYDAWQSTEYTNWSSATGDFTKFQDAQTNLGY